MSSNARSFNPLHKRVNEDLIRRIVEGEWRPGDLLPSEMELALEYGVSLGTVRKAIDEFAQRKLIVRRQGKGTFVARTSDQHEPFRFYRLVSVQGETSPETTEYLSCTRTKATLSDATNLGIKPKSPIVKVGRLRKYRGEGVVLERISLREDLCPGLREILDSRRPVSIHAVLEREYHLLITHVDERLYAMNADAKSSQLIDVPRNSPILQISRQAYILQGGIVEHRAISFATKHIQYVNRLF